MDISRTTTVSSPDISPSATAAQGSTVPQTNHPAPSSALASAKPNFGSASRTELDAAVAAANRAIAQSSSSLRFALDDVSGHIVVKLIDDATNQVVKQFPTEQMLAIARDITRMQQGMLLSEKT